jgi:alkylhydroperoxidase family enzyme
MLPALGSAAATAHVRVLSNAEAWKTLPPAEEGFGQRLPSWVRALAVSLPKTAAALIDWDYAQRVESPLPAQLRAKLRWITAQANRCEYAKACARADFVRAGGRAEDIDNLHRQLDRLPPPERLALKLMVQLAEAGYTVSDSQVTRLVELYGEKQVAAMVLLAAYANFQDRLLLALGVPVEEDGPLSPVKVRFQKSPPPGQATTPKKDEHEKPIKEAPRRILSPPALHPPAVPERVDDPEWTAVSAAELRDRINHQITRRQSRIRIPDAQAVRANLPDYLPQPDNQLRIVWHLVTYGYQPRLTAAWSGAGRAFREDSEPDPVFRGSLFWVVTRATQCFY